MDDRRVKVAHLCSVDMTARFLLLTQLKALKACGLDVSVICARGSWLQQVEQSGIRHIPWVRATRSWNPSKDAGAALELFWILRRERFDLVHTHNPKPGILGRIAAYVAGVPVVMNTVHGFYAQPDDHWKRRVPVMKLEKLAARFSHLELYQSKEDLEWARRLGISDDHRRAFLGNGAALETFDPAKVEADRSRLLRTELSIPQNAIVVGTVGRIVEEKGYRDLFEAIRQLRELVPELVLLAVGDLDPQKSDAIAEDEARSAGAIVTGWRENVSELIALMDVFVLASWREGVPRSAIEAASMQKPLVLTDIRGCREVARDGKEALLVPPRDPSSLAAAILKLIRDPALGDRLASAARARALEYFDEERAAERVVAHSLHLLRRSGRLPVKSGDRFAIRRASVRDARSIAYIHTHALPDAFLPKLGPGFLTQLYRTMVVDPSSVVLVAETDDRLCGFVAGTTSVGRLYKRFLVRRGIVAALGAVPRLIRPSTMKRVWETARYPASAEGLPSEELLAIGILADTRQSGLGSQLGQTFLTELRALGADQVKVVVAADNRAGNSLYEKLGFELSTQFDLHGDARSNIWIKRWSSPSASPLR